MISTVAARPANLLERLFFVRAANRSVVARRNQNDQAAAFGGGQRIRMNERGRDLEVPV
jgi:hypothetical protein